MSYHLARPAGANDTVLWLSTPEGDLAELGRMVAVAETRTLRAALDHGRASPEYTAALAVETTAEAALAAAQALVDTTVESTLALDTILKADDEYLVVRFVGEDAIEVGRAQFGSARAAHSGGLELSVARLRVEALVDVELIVEGAPVSAGDKGDVTMAFDGRITSARLIADAAGDIVVDVLKSHFPTAPSASITGAAPLVLAAALTYEDLALPGWTTAFLRGDVLRFVVVSAAVVSRVTVSLTCTTAV